MMKKFMKKLWDKKDSKKGFTLVELIVVLVILAILAALMVPALIGWIDKAKEKQASISARTVYLAAQTIASEKYAKATGASGDTFADLWDGNDKGDIIITDASTDEKTTDGEIKKLAAVTDSYVAVITAKDGKVVGIRYTAANLPGDPIIIGEDPETANP